MEQKKYLMTLLFKQDTMAQNKKDEPKGSPKAENIIPHENHICQVKNCIKMHKILFLFLCIFLLKNLKKSIDKAGLKCYNVYIR
jgi:hypothetical protein